MKTLHEIRHTLAQQKSLLAQKYGVAAIGIFGSRVRGEQTNDSDLDILVELEKPIRIGLLAFIGMQNYLSDLLNMKVDLSIRDDLKPLIGKHVMEEVIML